MNSIIEVSQNIFALIGSETASEFKLERIRESLSLAKDSHIKSREIYFFQLREGLAEISENDVKKLSDLLDTSDTQDIKEESFFILSPRIGTISPWSSKATEIIRNCGIDCVERVERGFYYSFLEKIDAIELMDMGINLSDKMTQSILLELDEIPQLFSRLEPGQVQTIDIASTKIKALQEANKELGLALSEEEITYLYESYAKTNQDPTDAELMMFAQANSEHCSIKSSMQIGLLMESKILEVCSI